jgi:hypothetical protein
MVNYQVQQSPHLMIKTDEMSVEIFTKAPPPQEQNVPEFQQTVQLP